MRCAASRSSLVVGRKGASNSIKCVTPDIVCWRVHVCIVVATPVQMSPRRRFRRCISQFCSAHWLQRVATLCVVAASPPSPQSDAFHVTRAGCKSEESEPSLT